MRKAKTWVPPSIPLADDLPAWKLICEDIHERLLEASLFQTTSENQLDFDDVTELPADGTFAGFREYQFDDGLEGAEPIIIRIEFGCGIEGLFASTNTAGNASTRIRTLRIKVSYSAGGIFSNPFEFPQALEKPSATGTSTSQLTNTGVSHYSIDTDQGFFAFFYGVGSRNKPFAHTGGAYYGASLVIMIQRFTDENGNPISGGFSCWGSALDALSSGDWSNASTNGRIDTVTAGGVTESFQSTVSPFYNEGTGSAGASHLFPVFMKTPTGIRQWPCVVTYRMSDIDTGSTFPLHLPGPTSRLFLAVGNQTSIGVCPLSANRRGIAIQFENDV